MPSPVGPQIAQLLNDLDRALTEALDLTTPFQDVPTEPGQRFGIADLTSWDSNSEPFNEQEVLRIRLWIVTSHPSYTAWRDAASATVADLRSLLPSIQQIIDSSGLVLYADMPASIAPTKRAPIQAPNTQTEHLWIGDIDVPITLHIAVAKDQLGAHLGS